jgi:hypothetical protein
MNLMYDKHLLLVRQGLVDCVKNARDRALDSVVTELIEVLAAQNYGLHDLVEALADHCEQRPYLGEVVHTLDKAAKQLATIHEELH